MAHTDVQLARSYFSRTNRRVTAMSAFAATFCLAVGAFCGNPSANAQSAPRAAAAKPAPASQPKGGAATDRANGQDTSTRPQIVAVVNREEISRNDLAGQCLRHYGDEVLGALVNKQMVLQACKAGNVVITRADVHAEINRLAKQFKLPPDRLLSLLEEERGISAAQYANDIIWPMLALRRLAASELEVTQAELQAAHETKYGPAVKVRLIVCDNGKTAAEVHTRALAAPQEFGRLAKQHSVDPNSAAASGLVQPIRKHMGDKKIEQVAFRMKPGDISPVVQVGPQFAILKCEEQVAPRNVPLETVAATLEEEIRANKEREAANAIFKKIQENTVIETIFNDPVKSKQMPGVAAVVNGHKITVRELGEQCIERHGVSVLDGVITRRLVEQAAKKAKIVVTQADIDQEITRAAEAFGQMQGTEGKPDVQGWLEKVTQEQGVSIETYIHEAVWPSVALKKLVGEKVQITDEDLKKGYEANYGPRVRCLAIVLNNQRRAQEVWEMARDNSTAQFFGDLAEQYSIEASSRSLRGEVPPVQRHGGQPLLEKEAFALKPGELSGVVQVDDKFVILRCEGFTKPTQVSMAEVKDLLYQDLHEKKQRLAMAAEVDRLEQTASVDNYLAGTVQSPQDVTNLKRAGAQPALKQVPSAKSPATATKPAAPRQR